MKHTATTLHAEALAGLIDELLDPLREFIAHEPYLAHKYGYPDLLARAKEAIGQGPRAEAYECPPDCTDCARFPPDARDPLPDAAWTGHQPVSELADGEVTTSCSCGGMPADDRRGAYADHVRTCWEQGMPGRLRQAALDDAAQRAVHGPTAGGPLRALIPGDGREPASDDLAAAVAQVVGHDIHRYDPSGEPQQANVARCRAFLRRWGRAQTRHPAA